ncbi:MAG: hypothetical protein KC656_26110, partial [Myxococcales bacterium]|nr:hypothetical protein [Myxococcales bacterium]
AQEDDWEHELEADFFGETPTLDPPPARPEPALPVFDHREAPTEPHAPIRTVQPADDVIQVVPRWVWPTLATFALLAVAGTAFGLGAAWATHGAVSAPTQTVQPVQAAPEPSPQAPETPTRPSVVEAPPVKAAAPPPPVRRAPRKARPKPPAPPAPVAAPAPQPAPPTATPLSPSDLPRAVSVSQLQPGAAL